MFLAPQDKRREIPKQPKKENAKQLENVPLNRTFVAYLNERGSVGHLIPNNPVEKEMRNLLFKITPAKFTVGIGSAE